MERRSFETDISSGPDRIDHDRIEVEVTRPNRAGSQPTRSTGSRRSTPESDPIEAAILRTILYFDLFDFPLDEEEIIRYLSLPIDDVPRLRSSLAALVANGTLGQFDRFYAAGSRPRSIVDRRHRREAEGRQMWRRARLVARLLRHVPFLRGIFISGSLAHALAEEGSDIDYFIVTEPDRLWLVRTLLVLLRRTLLLNRRTYLCVNYFVTTDNLAIAERQIYAACETASLRPLLNLELHRQFLEENSWIADYYPNHRPERNDDLQPIDRVGSRTQRILERLVPSGPATRLDRRLMRATERFWKRKYPTMSSEQRERNLRTTPNESRAHADDYTLGVLADYARSLEVWGLGPEESE